MAEIYRYDCVTSTSDVLSGIEGAEEGTIVLARAQTAGRGRLGRSFHSPGGKGVYLSMLLRPKAAPEEVSSLTAWAAVAAARAVKELTDRTPGIKWVNDLILSGKKICGILTQAVFSPGGALDKVIVGVGLNVLHEKEDFPPELRQKAGSLLSVTGRNIDLSKAEDCLIKHLLLLTEDFPAKRDEYLAFYRKHCITLGKEVLLTDGTTGTAEKIDDDFSLTVRLSEGTLKSVRSGEASVRLVTGEYI